MTYEDKAHPETTARRLRVAREIDRTFRDLKNIEEDIVYYFTGFHNWEGAQENNHTFNEAFQEIVMFNNNENFGEFVQPIADIASALRAIRYGVSDIVNTLQHDPYFEAARDYSMNGGMDDSAQEKIEIERQRKKASMLQMKCTIAQLREEDLIGGPKK